MITNVTGKGFRVPKCQRPRPWAPAAFPGIRPVQTRLGPPAIPIPRTGSSASRTLSACAAPTARRCRRAEVRCALPAPAQRWPGLRESPKGRGAGSPLPAAANAPFACRALNTLHFPHLPPTALIAASRGGVVELGERQGSRQRHTGWRRNVIKQWERGTCFFPFKVCSMQRCGKVNYPSLRDAPNGICASYLN